MTQILGAAAQLAAREFGFEFRVRERNLSVGVSQITVLKNQPDRTSILLINTGTTTITLSTRSPVASGSGIILASNGGSFSANVRDDAITPAWTWYAIGSGAGGSIQTLEVIADSRKPT